MDYRFLIINMGSTSTKVGVYLNDVAQWTQTISHPREDISRYLHFMDQYDYRLDAILALLTEKSERLEDFQAIISRGGTIQPVAGGTYRITQKMLDDSQCGRYGDHPCNIGGQIAFDLAAKYDCMALTVDPPVCNEICKEATFSGLPEIERIESFQALNHRATARKYCRDHQVNYQDVNLIVAHMGGGITVAAHQKGKITDVNNGLAGDGPFALERSGDLPVGELIKLCYSGKYSLDEMLRHVNRRGGMVAYLGTMDGKEVDRRIADGDELARDVTNAMAYQVGKEIGGITAAMKGEVDAIVLTAGLAYWDYFVECIKERVSFIAPVVVYPGENELESLALGALRVLRGQEAMQDYDSQVS
ncbi:MAG: butyrate kinase [Lachnospiraceae bacterium]|nr:butyrate kinase [Lachnospiraceae bacterium]